MATFQFLILHSVAPRHSSNGRRVPGIRRSCICGSLGFSGDENYTPGMKKIVPCNVNKEINNVWLLSNVLRRSWLYHRDRSRVLIQTVIEHFVFLSTATARAPCFNVRCQYSSKERPWRFRLHCHGCHHALMLMCQNPPWSRSCECYNNFLFPYGCQCQLDSNSMVITSSAPIGTRSRLAAHIIRAAYERGSNTVCPGIHKVGVRLATRSAVAIWNHCFNKSRNNRTAESRETR